MDAINKVLDKAPGWVKELFDHNRWSTLATGLVILLGLNTVGCDMLMKTVSPVTGKKVDQVQLQTDYDVWQIQYKSKVEALKVEGEVMEKKFQLAQGTLDTQRQTLQTIVGGIGTAIQAVPGPWTGLLATALPILTGGLLLDNRRKDQKLNAAQEIAAASIQATKE